jgi:hypothetical protein
MPVISKELGQFVLNSQERPPADEAYPMTVVSTPSSNALLVIDSGDRFNPSQTVAVNNANPTAQYNHFVIARPQNLIQGAFTRVGLTEVRFPYCIPNVNETNSSMWVKISANAWAEITLFEGFYTGAELATAIETQIQSLPGGAGISVTFDSGTGRFSFFDPAPAPGLTLALSPVDLTVPKLPIVINSQRSLLDLLGMPPIHFTASANLVSGLIQGGIADLKYTDYIDIVSSSLTNNQKVKDTSTQNLIPRNAIITRLFIEDETSQNRLADISGGTPSLIPGTFPFTIYRQYKNPKMMRWNNTVGAVGQIDISLFDMYGNRLYVPVAVLGQTAQEPIPDFQLTFQLSED